MQHNLGWRKDEPDDRDRPFVPDAAVASKLPSKIDFSTSGFECQIFDQRPLASCSAHAIGAMFYFVNQKEARPAVQPSRLFIYYNERKVENTVATDSGAQIRTGIKTVAALGICDESEWPYDPSKFAQEPPPDRYTNAIQHRAIEYFSLAGQLADLQACLAAGYPFVFGMSIYPSFGTPAVAQTGVVPMPGPTEAVVCGHAVMALGYDQSAQTFLIRNSFGVDWGMKGYFSLPFAFMESRACSDNFWTIRRV